MNHFTRRSLYTLPPALLAATTLTGFHDGPKTRNNTPPNILIIMVDQMQTPPEGYKDNEGAVRDMKEILGFRSLSPGNAYTGYFKGLMRLRQNAVVMKKHYTASSASVPSRCCIMTGQYPTVTGVDQTDGLFKTAADVPFLDPSGTPTIGDWFRAAGYSTHYFGKWHVSEPAPPDYLDTWGFSDWESSYPEPHGGTADNLGVYRDVVFTDRIDEFFQQEAANPSGSPWLAVGSLVDPHDISAWPIQWQVPDTNGVVPWVNYPPVISFPSPGAQSLYGIVPTVINGQQVSVNLQVGLNPDGFPQANSSLPPTYSEDLSYKPLCQQDYRLKWGLAWGSKTDYTFISGHAPYRSPHPFQLQGAYADAWALSYVQFYFYSTYLADLQISRILQSLDNNHLTDNTIILFVSDHGDMTAAHGGMIQKWHNAYEETTRVPMIVSSQLVNTDKDNMREITQPTSSIDIAPTLLGLAGIDPATIRDKVIQGGHTPATPSFAGADLSQHILGNATGPITGPDGNPRSGACFMTNDMITEPNDNPDATFPLFLSRVDSTINLGYPLAHGTVRQPNNIRALCTGDWKIVQYVDPNHTETDQWELYCLTIDPTEVTNLVNYATGDIRTDVTVPGMTYEQLVAKNDTLRKELAKAVGIPETGQDPGSMTLRFMPNPAAQSSAIAFNLAAGGPVRIVLTDLTGKAVATIVNKDLGRGYHRVTVDTGRLPQGVYLCRLESGNQRISGKLVIIR